MLQRAGLSAKVLSRKVRCLSTTVSTTPTRRVPTFVSHGISGSVARAHVQGRQSVVKSVGQSRFFSASMNRLETDKKVNNTEEQEAVNGENAIENEFKKAEEELKNKITELEQTLKKAQEDLKSEQIKKSKLNDHLKQAMQEAENLRVRTKKDVEAAQNFAIQKFAKSLVGVADVFELAMTSIKVDDVKAKNDSLLTSLHEGMVMTESELLKVFEKHGLKKVNPVGEKFDVNFHEALFQVPDPTKENGVVAMCQKSGYILNGRTLRAAGVGIVKNA